MNGTNPAEIPRALLVLGLIAADHPLLDHPVGLFGKDLDPAECDPSGICGVISLEDHPA
jgi:hypothetical protein